MNMQPELRMLALKGVGSPEFAASDDGMVQVYVASAAKIAAMLAAFQLRHDLRTLLKLTKPASLAALYDERRSRWADSQTDPGGRHLREFRQGPLFIDLYEPLRLPVGAE